VGKLVCSVGIAKVCQCKVNRTLWTDLRPPNIRDLTAAETWCRIVCIRCQFKTCPTWNSACFVAKDCESV